MLFNNTEHKNRYEKIKGVIGFAEDKGEYASFFYILTSKNIYPKINLVLDKDYKFKGADVIEEAIAPLCKSEKVLINLAMALYRSVGGDSVIDIFPSLDANNRQVAIEAIKIRYGM